MRTKTTIVLAALLVLGLMPSAAPAADQAALEPVSETDNIDHVTNVTFDDIRPNNTKATDSDFMVWEVPADFVMPDDTNIGKKAADIPADYADRLVPGTERVFNLMGTYVNGLWITDVTDPEDPVVVSRWDCGILQSDVFVFQQGSVDDGTLRQFAAYTQDATNAGNRNSQCFQDIEDLTGDPLPGNSRGTFIAEVTDPFRPATVSFLRMRKGTHQTTVHPDGQFIYNSAAVLVNGLGTIEVYDVSDPATPTLVSEIQLLTGLDSHDMTFDAEGDRLYVAALTHSFVIDTSDPADPQIISRIFDPAINIHHDAHVVSVDTPAGDRDFMLIGDELGGATPTGMCPGGGIHVYDVTGPLENAPVKVGAFFIPEVRATSADVGGVRTCTAHVIQPLPDTTLLSVAWYNAGVRVLDYSGLADLGPGGVSVGVLGQSLPVGIVEVGHSRFADSNLWSAKVLEVEDDGFFIFGGDTRRTLDIWRFDLGTDSGAEDTGVWLNPTQAMDRALKMTGGISTLDSGLYTPYCMLGNA
jgi:hypothetical protein